MYSRRNQWSDRDASVRLGLVVQIVFAAAVVTLTSCATPANRNKPVPAADLVAIEVTAAEALSWSYRRESTADLDGDGAGETIVIASDVQLSEKGLPLWEDGHRWALIILDTGENTLAYSAFVPRGFVEAAVLQPSASRKREVLVQERTPERLRSFTIAYTAPGQATAASAAYYQVENWLPGSARLTE